MATTDTPRMVIGVPTEARAGETRVALTPTALPQLTKVGFDVVIESGAGSAAGYPDSAFTDRGARVGTRDDAFAADVVVQVNVMDGDPASADLARLTTGQVVVGAVAPFARPELVKAVAVTGATLFALELVPRTTRAQSMDILSSQAGVAGYKAVLMAANEMPKMFPLLTTAAGTIAPAKVFIVGAGVARGYRFRPDLTADRFRPDPYATRAGARMYRTGDRVVQRADGVCEFLGRCDDQFKLRGYRVEPG